METPNNENIIQSSELVETQSHSETSDLSEKSNNVKDIFKSVTVFVDALNCEFGKK